MKSPSQTGRSVATERSTESLISIIYNKHASQPIQIRLNSNMKASSQRYQKLQLLGQGSSGKIYKVLRKDTKQILAAKIISSQTAESQLQAIQLQVELMTRCNHPHVIKCHGIELFEQQIWILLEYCEGGSLVDIMQSQKITFTEEQISDIMMQVLDGLSYLHENRIVHRDIKASNLLYHDGNVKISDFGVALLQNQRLNESKLSRIGSPFWMSPEVLSQSVYTTKADIWALGITAIELAQSEPPYSHQHPFRAIYSIQTHPPQGLTKPEQWSSQFTSFVKQCLTVDYQSRPQAEMLRSHPFVSKKHELCSYESSPSNNSLEEQDTIILHDELPKSIWEKGSFPQTEQKELESPQRQFNSTVVINEDSSEISLFSNLKKALEDECLSSAKPKAPKHKENILPNNVNLDHLNQIRMGVAQKQKMTKQLYRQMQQQVKLVRSKYMTIIRQLYSPPSLNESKQEWESPVRKLRQKNCNLLRQDHCRFSSEVIKKLL